MRREMLRSVCILLSFRTGDQHVPHQHIPRKAWTECGVNPPTECSKVSNKIGSISRMSRWKFCNFCASAWVRLLQVAAQGNNAATKRMVRNFHLKVTVTSERITVNSKGCRERHIKCMQDQ
jgi:hypothetical protein